MIGRIVMYLVIAALGAFVIAATFFVEGGGKSTATIGEIAVVDIVERPGQYDDKEIATRGTLEYEEEPAAYYLTDEDERLRLVYEPGGIEEFVGDEVRVTGRLQYDDGTVYIDADRVRPTEA